MEHNKFSPSTIGLFQAPYYKLGGRYNFKCVQNPIKKELKNGIYKPRLTVTKRPWLGVLESFLRIEFSIPKLVFGNNFDEVNCKQFERIIKRLYDSLYTMGVLVMPQMLREAHVSSVHYSKNIILTDYSTPYGILKELSKIDLNQRLDMNQTDYRNEGHSLKFRANSYEISLYDKKKDLRKAKISEKRAIEQDNALQLNFFDQWKPKGPFEVLRMEIRLNKRQKIKQIFNQLKIISDLTFRSVFKKSIAQKVLLFYFEEIKQSYSMLTYQPKSVKDFISDFKINNPEVKIRKMLQVFAVKTAIDDMGVREFREITRPYGNHNWNRLKKDISTYQFPVSNHSPLKTIQKCLKEFKSVKLTDHNEISL